MMLDPKEKERYSRQILLSELGEEGQEKLKNSSVLVVGTGGLGSPAVIYLAAAGIGHIGIIDNDTVSLSNLQRQILYSDSQIGRSKVGCAAEQIRRINPGCCVDTYDCRLVSENADALFSGYDAVVDACDNLKTRYVIDKAAVSNKIPYIYGSVCEYSGQVAVFNYKGGRKYPDLYPWHPGIETFEQPMGIIGVLTGTVGSIQAAETVKTLLGKPSLNDRLLLIDIRNMEFNIIDF